MISHSPPIFSHSPPVSYFTNYMSDRRQNLNYNDDAHGGNSLNSRSSSGNSSNRTPHYCRSQMFALASKAMVSNAQRLRSASPVRSVGFNGSGGLRSGGGMFACGLGRVVSSPNFITQPKSCLSRKSCLHKDEDSDESTDSRPRKHVIFADDEGHSLTEVRVMSEPSNVPPYWSMKFLEQITQGLVSPQPADQWTVDFKQPASDYLSFRQKIDTKFVSLENVIVRDEESIVVGTVKVKNISFEKEVIVRVTWDDWKSQQDIFCTFARAYGANTCAHVVFDTFSFKITLPPSSKRLEFCICFRAKDLEYWDNNDGKNYTITKRSPFYYNALSPYDKSSTRNSSQAALMSTLSEALARPASNGQQQEPSPYW